MIQNYYSWWTPITSNTIYLKYFRITKTDRLKEVINITRFLFCFRAFVEVSENPIGIFFPTLAKLAPKLSGWENFVVGVNHFKALIGSSVNEHKSNFSPDSEPKDFIESYLQEITKTTDPTSSFYKDTGGANLCNIRSPINSNQS